MNKKKAVALNVARKYRADGGQTYTIKRDDVLSRLAKQFGTSVENLMAVNPQIKDRNKIKEGATLNIPQFGNSNVAGPPPPPPPPPAPPPPKPKPEPAHDIGMPVLTRSEWNKLAQTGGLPDMSVTVADPPPPPMPTIKREDVPQHPNSDQFPPAVEGGDPSILQQAHEAIDPVRVLNGTNSPNVSDYLSTALWGLGAGAPSIPGIAQPMAGTARDFGLDEALNQVRGGPPRNLMGNRFARMNPEAMGETPLRTPPQMGRGPRTPPFRVNGRFVAGDPIRSWGMHPTMEPTDTPTPMGDFLPKGWDVSPEPSMGPHSPYILSRAPGGMVPPFSAPGLPVQDVGDVLQFYRKQGDQLGTEGARTYMGGANARVGTPEWNSQYEAQNGLRPGSLVESNAGRGDVVNVNPKFFAPDRTVSDAEKYAPVPGGAGGETPLNHPPLTPAEQNELNKVRGGLGAGQPGYTPEEAAQRKLVTSDYSNLNWWLNNPKLQDKFNLAWSQLTAEEKMKFMKLYPNNFKASGGEVDTSKSTDKNTTTVDKQQYFPYDKMDSLGSRWNEGNTMNRGYKLATGGVPPLPTSGHNGSPAGLLPMGPMGMGMGPLALGAALGRPGPYSSGPGKTGPAPTGLLPPVGMGAPIGAKPPMTTPYAPIPGQVPMAAGGPTMAPKPGSTGIPKLPTGKGVPPQSVMVERAGGIGMARKSGFLHSPVPGRTDHIPLGVKSGSYVIPADVVAGHGQGNSLAGAQALDSMFKSGPYGSATAKMSIGRAPTAPKLSYLNPSVPHGKMPGQRASGGGAGEVPVMAAGGEYIVPPEAVSKIGGGDSERGFRILDKFVLNSRKKHIKTLKGLKPPKKD